MANLSEREQARAIGRELQDAIEDLTVQLAKDITLELNAATPEDTGLARESWIPARGNRRSVPAPTSPADAARAADQGLREIESFDLKRDKVIIVGNPTPYIEDLARGSSPKARTGFIGRVIASVVSRTRTIRSRRRR